MKTSNENLAKCVHFVGFRDDRYWNAVKVFGSPQFIHRGWDLRAQRETARIAAERKQISQNLLA
jgi:hypothetical protein